jgi:hypothetical protein
MARLTSTVGGIVMPPFETLARFHPQFALAIDDGVPVRPDLRPLSVDFDSSAQIGNFEPASFSEIISSYSVFGGCDLTIDPTSAFAGNPLKYLNDVGQALVTGITFTLAVRARGDDYTPIIDETPLQSVCSLLGATAGMWNLDNPDNVKARFTLAAFPNGASTPGFPITVWLTFVFLVLGSEGATYMCMSPKDARAELRKRGWCCPPGQTPPQAT